MSTGITPSYFAPGSAYHLGSHLSQTSCPTTQVKIFLKLFRSLTLVGTSSLISFIV